MALDKVAIGRLESSLNNEPRCARRWPPPMSLQEIEDQSEISTRPPVLSSAHALLNGAEGPSSQESDWKTVNRKRDSFEPCNRESVTLIKTVPPSQDRTRSTSPTERRSFVRSDSASEGSAEQMDRRESEYDREIGYNFEVQEQDRWLPIANVSRIMKQALPENAKIAKETKECMQECVSEFISFITSEGM